MANSKKSINNSIATSNLSTNLKSDVKKPIITVAESYPDVLTEKNLSGGRKKEIMDIRKLFNDVYTEIFKDEIIVNFFPTVSQYKPNTPLDSYFATLYQAMRDDVKNIVGQNDAGAAIKQIHRLYISRRLDAEARLFPYEIILGLYFTALKDMLGKGKFGPYCSTYFEYITPRTRQNYMQAAKIIQYQGMEKYYYFGISLIYKISKILDSNEEYKKIADPLAAEIKKLRIKEIKGQEDATKADIKQAVNVVFFDKVEMPKKLSKQTKDLLYNMWDSGLELKDSDILFIKKNKLENDEIQEYFSLLKRGNAERKVVRDIILAKKIPQPNKLDKIGENTPLIVEDPRPTNMSYAIANLKYTCEYYMNKEKKLSKFDFKFLSELSHDIIYLLSGGHQ